MWWFKKKEVAAPEPAKEPEAPKVGIRPEAVAEVRASPKREFQRYEPPKGVIPEAIKSAILAMDSTPYDDLNAAYGGYGYGDFDSFPGYPYLATLAQKPEYRKMVGTIAEEMTRKWIKLKTVGDEDKADRVKQLEEAMKRFKVRERFKEAAEHDGYFGGGQIYIDVRSPRGISAWMDDNELQSKLFMSDKKITKGSLQGFRVIEPIWTYPNHAANAMGFVAALNFTQANGRCSLNGRQVSGLLPMISNDTDYEAAKANGYNFYGNYASNAVETNQWAPGSITGDYAWLDAWAGQVWVNAQLQAALVALFQQASNLPYAAAGKARIESCMKPTIEQFRAWGGMTAGTDLDQSQIDQINAIAGVDVTDSLLAEGYYVYIGPFTPAMRAARTKPTVYFWYTDGGIIQGITVNSTEVQ